MTRIEIFEPSPELYDEIERLGQLHKAETEATLTDLPCQLNRVLYDALHEAGGLVCVGAFADDGRLIGYASAFVSAHPHYALTAAQHDALFIHPDHRTPRLALRMLERVESECKARGAVLIAWHAKHNSAFARLIAARAKPEETVYIKEL